MTTETTRNLAREVAIALGWRIVHPDWMGEGHYELYMSDGRMVYDNGFSVLTDEGIDNAIPDYPNDLNACARDLKREGWRFSIKQWIEIGKPDTWLAEYYNNQLARGIGHWGDTPAVAWCESFLALCKHVDGQDGEGL